LRSPLRQLNRLVAVAALVAVLTACTATASRDTRRVIVTPTTATTTTRPPMSTTTTTIDPNVQTLNMAIVLYTERDIQLAATARRVTRNAVHGTWAATGGGAPCDGDLPPCWRIIGTESGGRWDAYNPGGCGGAGCWGPYQFSGEWAGKLGLPTDLTQTTKEQWVNAARALYANGAGCSNWDTCRR
jgi:hypothetical protein